MPSWLGMKMSVMDHLGVVARNKVIPDCRLRRRWFRGRRDEDTQEGVANRPCRPMMRIFIVGRSG